MHNPNTRAHTSNVRSPTKAHTTAVPGTAIPNTSCRWPAKVEDGVLGAPLGDARAASTVSANDVLLRAASTVSANDVLLRAASTLAVSANDVLLRAKAARLNSSTDCRAWD